MKKCSKCHVPLEGRMAAILGKVLRIKRSSTDPELCNKCAAGAGKGAYTCQICNRTIDEKSALTHVKTEEYILGLIKKDHPEWKNEAGTCPQCLDYYRALIKKAKI